MKKNRYLVYFSNRILIRKTKVKIELLIVFARFLLFLMTTIADYLKRHE